MSKQRLILEQALTAKIGVHVGRALIHAATAYPTFRKVIAEGAQNALDANAVRIIVDVNLKDRAVTIKDNGDGVSEEDFNKAIQLIHRSSKITESKLGRFGIGLIAGLGKCRSFYFISRPKKGGTFKQWTFTTSEIQECEENIEIPVIERPDLNKDTSFSSLITFVGIKQDRFISEVTASELAEEIRGHYNKALVRLGTVVSITVTDTQGNTETQEVIGEKYSGQKIETFVGTTKHGDAVCFNLWIAPRNTGQKPLGIVVGETGNDHTFPFSDLADSAAEWFAASPECLRALKLGLITGEITGDGVRLHANRKQFETSEALGEFCRVIIDWYTKIGKSILEAERENRKDDRFQNIGRDVLKKLEEIIPNFNQITQVIRSARFGSIGHGHANPSSGKVLDQTLPFNALGSTTGSGNGNPRTSRSQNPQERESHVPNLATGPLGEKRNRVRGSNSGLIIHFEPSAQNSLWQFDNDTATLTFNVAHPSWQKLEHSDEALAEMQLVVALMVLNMEGYRADANLYGWAEAIVPDNIDLLLAVIGSKFPVTAKKKKK